MSFYSKGFKATLTSAINAVNSLPFELTDKMYNVTNPRAISGVTGAEKSNTQATLVATGIQNSFGESYGKYVDVFYNRLDLSLLFKGVDVVWLTSSNNTKDFAAWVSNEFGIPMEASDIKAASIPTSSNNSYIEIEAEEDSPWITGKCHVYFTRGKPDLGDIIEAGWDSGAYTELPKVDSNYTLTYNYDYTGSGSLLRQGVTASTPLLRQNLWNALMGGRANQWASGITGVLYTGEANVKTAGGRAGFSNLLIVPKLNIWAHFND